MNQNVCIEMCKKGGSFNNNQKQQIKSKLLRWSVGDVFGDLGEILNVSSKASIKSEAAGLFDAIIVADCLFFKDYHLDLIWTLRHALAPTDKSFVYMLQPKRGSSMDTFIELAKPWFHVEIISNYSPKVAQMCQAFEEQQVEFNKDIHLPILLVLSLII